MEGSGTLRCRSVGVLVITLGVPLVGSVLATPNGCREGLSRGSHGTELRFGAGGTPL